ncbi:hypothetical protein THAOC_34065, partial [Thalassiosira oceanica]
GGLVPGARRGGRPAGLAAARRSTEEDKRRQSREYVVYSSDEECLDDGPDADDGSRHSGDGWDDDCAPLVDCDCAETDRPAPPGVDASERSAATVGDPLLLLARGPPPARVSFRTDLHQPARRRSVSFDGSSSAPSSAPSASLLRRPRYRVDATLMRRQLYALGGVPRMSDDVSIDVDDLLSSASGGDESIDPDDLLKSESSVTVDGPAPESEPEREEAGYGGGADPGLDRSEGGSAGVGGGVPPAFGGLYRDIDRGRGTGGEEDAPADARQSPRGGRRRAGRVQFVNRSQFEAVVMNS